MNTNTPAPTGVVSSTELGQPIAYLYHDASTSKDAHPWLHSTMLVLAVDRRQGLRGETPLVTLDQARAMVTAERERLLALAEKEAVLLEGEGMGPEANGVKAFIARATQPNTNSGTSRVGPGGADRAGAWPFRREAWVSA